MRALDWAVLRMIQISETAAKKIQSLMAKQGISDGGLRVGVKGGGCSGLSYTFGWERKSGWATRYSKGLTARNCSLTARACSS